MPSSWQYSFGIVHTYIYYAKAFGSSQNQDRNYTTCWTTLYDLNRQPSSDFFKGTEDMLNGNSMTPYQCRRRQLQTNPMHVMSRRLLLLLLYEYDYI